MNALTELKKSIESHRETLAALAQAIWNHPELAYHERFACNAQVELLKNAGFNATSPSFGLETAFRTDFGTGSPTFLICSEYDALPGIGHGCGHNLICTAAIAAFLALTDYMKAHHTPGHIILQGTPAEESGGGKVKLIENGFLEGVDAAMMLHPSWQTMPDIGAVANTSLKVSFTGKAAHAAGSPELGRSALDAVMLLFVGINAFRQMMPEFTRIHGIVNEGGLAPNIIPEHASCTFFIRSADDNWETKLIQRFREMVRGAAIMTDTKYQIEDFELPYKTRIPNKPMNDEYVKIAAELGMSPVIPSIAGRGSSDFGDVSHVVPGIHAYFAITNHKIPGHSVEMTNAANTPFALDSTLSGATAMASVALKYLTDTAFRAAVHEDFTKHTH